MDAVTRIWVVDTTKKVCGAFTGSFSRIWPFADLRFSSIRTVCVPNLIREAREGATNASIRSSLAPSTTPAVQPRNHPSASISSAILPASADAPAVDLPIDSRPRKRDSTHPTQPASTSTEERLGAPDHATQLQDRARPPPTQTTVLRFPDAAILPSMTELPSIPEVGPPPSTFATHSSRDQNSHILGQLVQSQRLPPALPNSTSPLETLARWLACYLRRLLTVVDMLEMQRHLAGDDWGDEIGPCSCPRTQANRPYCVSCAAGCRTKTADATSLGLSAREQKSVGRVRAAVQTQKTVLRLLYCQFMGAVARLWVVEMMKKDLECVRLLRYPKDTSRRYPRVDPLVVVPTTTHEVRARNHHPHPHRPLPFPLPPTRPPWISLSTIVPASTICGVHTARASLSPALAMQSTD
uniref:Uncharacterized protein n=1 Tax=Mycena chlorophos TaxID=658473 RepID=A0ABQ0KY23_MYCCL|nr:predicted protein [Mycena chlorophos]